MYKLLYNICMTNDPDIERFPIRELVRRTGVNASTLRAWETRHQLLTPVRTESGHRLYSERDAQRVRRLRELLALGHGLAQAQLTLDAEMTGQDIPDGGAHGLSTSTTGVEWASYIAETLRAIEDFSTDRLDLLYNEACAVFPIDLLTRNLLIPVLEQLGERWDARASGIAEEHFFSAWLRNKLGARLHHSLGQSRGRLLLLACIENESHEIGLLLFALGVLHRGYRVVYLGASLPTRQIIHVARKTHAAGIVLAGRDQPDAERVLADIAWLAKSSNAKVFVGSHFSTCMADALRQVEVTPLGDDIDAGLDRLDTTLTQRARRKA